MVIMNFPGRLIGVLMVVIIIFVFPLQYIAGSNSDNIDSLVDGRTKRLSNEIREKGYIDKLMYENYVDFLDTTGEMYDIEIQDINPVKGEEIVSAGADGANKHMHTHTKAGFSNKLMHSSNNKSMITSLTSTKDIHPFATHTHTDACYQGHRHSDKCYTNTGDVSSYTNIYRARLGGGWGSLGHDTKILDITCCHCDQRILQITYRDYSHGDGVNPEEYPDIIDMRGVYFNSSGTKVTLDDIRYDEINTSNFQDMVKDFDLMWNFLEDRLGAVVYGESYIESVLIDWTGVSIPVMGFYPGCTTYYSRPIRTQVCGQTEDNTPICHQVVTSITATKPNQTVKKVQAIVTTATATYLDGHTGMVNCTSNYNPNLIGVQTVTLTYKGLVGNAKTNGTRTCTVSVTVEADRNLTSLTVTPQSQNIEKYSKPSFLVRANYSDGTNMTLNTSQYTLTGLDISKIGLQSVAISYTESGITKSASAYITVVPINKECPRCHRYYELNPDDTDPGCPYCVDIVVGIEVAPAYVEVTKGSSLPITVKAKYMDGTESQVSGWVSNYNPERLGLQIVTIEYGGYGKDITVWVNDEVTTCPICNTDYPKSESSCPVCSEKVIRIDVSPDEITIMQYETISLKVTAFYADGSSREVDEWSIDTATGKPGTYKATVSYKGAKDTVTLNIISVNSIECPICHTIYDVIESPSGCPICSKEIIGIEAYLTSGGNLVQYGSNPNIVIILVFRDDHREFGNGEYTIKNYNPQELGIQTITVIYKGYTTTMVIEVVNMVNEIICPNGHIYHSNTDGSDPGCPYCHTGEDVSKIAYFDITYTSKILDTIYLEGRYYFTKGNYVSIIVIKKYKSLLYKMQNTFFSTSMLGRKRKYIHGGEVY